ncbi:MAG: DUF2817 domain-containing protein [Bacilli bacterium]|nr:DUF2817 domain-containing protein [Bacilli bacterium]
MFEYCKDFQDVKNNLQSELKLLKMKGYHILTKKHPITQEYDIDKIVIKSKDTATNRLVFTLGLHGIEGYVGHASLITFFHELLPSISDKTEIVILHGLNPFGMANFRRSNENNVDLNRNFSTNNFTSENLGFELVSSFFSPKKYKSVKTANLSFYTSLVGLIGKHGIKTLKEATLLGQKSAKDSIYYSGTSFEKTTTFVLDELPRIFEDVKQVVWIDLHTGYGPRYQMSIVNSKYEKTTTKEMIENIKYSRILGLNADDFYDVDGDMIEMIYQVHQERKSKCALFATCFEYGTLGEETKKTISSLKAMVFENSNYFKEQNEQFKAYAINLIKEQFLPSEELWRVKAEQDFLVATKGIMKYYKI